MNELIHEPWPWYVAGPLIAFVLFLMYFFGRNFGVSTNLETFCTIGGAGKFSSYFKTDWKARTWSLVFVLGIVIGGYLASHFMMGSAGIDLNPQTVSDLAALGFADAGATFLPAELFGTEQLFSVKGIALLLGGGLLVGFGTRYAGGCTSGHAITGLSSLQFPSLLATIGFFIGGLCMIWVIFPLLF